MSTDNPSGSLPDVEGLIGQATSSSPPRDRAQEGFVASDQIATAVFTWYAEHVADAPAFIREWCGAWRTITAFRDASGSHAGAMLSLLDEPETKRDALASVLGELPEGREVDEDTLRACMDALEELNSFSHVWELCQQVLDSDPNGGEQGLV